MQVSEEQFDVAQDSLFRQLGQATTATDRRIGDEMQRPCIQGRGRDGLDPLLKQGQVVGVQP